MRQCSRWVKEPVELALKESERVSRRGGGWWLLTGPEIGARLVAGWWPAPSFEQWWWGGSAGLAVADDPAA